MSVYFEKVSRFSDVDLPIPTPSTSGSAGYDFVVAEDIVIPPMDFLMDKLRDKLFDNNPDKDYWGFIDPVTLDEVASMTKELKAKIPLVSTGMKCHLDPGQYLELSMRSSTPLKHWLILGNSIGIIDSDYYNNPDNEGEIFAQIINLLPFAVQLKRGDRLVQGIVHNYGVAEGEASTNERVGGFGSTGS